MLPSAATTGVENWSWSQAVGLPAVAPRQNAAEPEISCGAVQVLPPSWLTASMIGDLIVAPPLPSWKSVQVTITFPLPQAVMYSLSLEVPGPVMTPVPPATRTVSQVLPPSVEWATRMSGFLNGTDLPWLKPNPSVDM